MEIISTLLSKVASGIGPFFLLLGLLIFVHELGHYLVAVYFGVRVETFSLGFGKKLFSYKRGETTYCLSLIPLGGYVKMYGDDPSVEIPESEKKHSFLHKPVWPRIAIVLAGPLMNLFFAIIVFAAVGLMGESVPSSKLGDISTKSIAYASGFRSGDVITQINDTKVTEWREVKELIEPAAEKVLTFTVTRESDGKSENIQSTPVLGKNSFIFSTQRQVGIIEGLETDSTASIVGVKSPNSAAALAGVKSFDIIEKINGTEITYFRQMENLISKSGESLTLVVRAFDQEGKTPEPRTVNISLSSLDKNLPYLDQLGLERPDLYLLNIKPKSPAAVAGLKSGDTIVKLNGTAVESWQSVLNAVKTFDPKNKSISFTFLREDKEQTVDITPEQIELPTEQGAMETRYAIGVIPALLSAPTDAVVSKITNPAMALVHGVEQSWVWSKLIAVSLVRLVQNEVSAKNIGGVITIGRVASKSFEVGAVAFMKMMAIISINLFLLNLLPVPVLDGGHLVFFTLEAIKGTPISFKKLEIAQQVGLVLLLSLMMFALFNDISHLISSW